MVHLLARVGRLAAACVLALGATGQGVVNRSLLVPPRDDAAQLALRTPPLTAAVQVARPAVVHVEVEVTGPKGVFPMVRPSSGVVVDASGLVLTLWHLVADAQGAADKRLFVQLDDAARTRLPAKLLGGGADSGLALLSVTPPASGLAPVVVGGDLPPAGTPVALLANPEGSDVFVFAGVASPALAAPRLSGTTIPLAEVFLTDTKQDLRCDGAPVVDAEGRLLGLFAAEHVGRDQAEPTLEDLRRPSFGIVVANRRIRSAFAAEFARAGNSTLRAAPAAAAAAPAPEVAAVAAVAPAVLAVRAGPGESFAPNGADPGATRRLDGVGSAVVLTESGLLVTNGHLVAKGPVQVVLADGQVLAATVKKRHGGTNLALLQVELPAGRSLVAARCGVDDDLQVGETVLAVGNPGGGAPVVSAGVVSAIRERENGRVQADPNLGAANAGGAIVDLAGRLCGIADGGAVDPLEIAYATRGDRVTTETNLSTFVGIRRLREVFRDELAGAGAVLAPAPVQAGERAARDSRLVRMLQKASGASLNIYVAQDVRKQDPDDPFAEYGQAQLVTLGVGSGVVIDPSGLALSNWHVVAEAVRPDGSAKPNHAVRASVFGGKTYPVRVLSISREDDLSLLQLELAPGETLSAIELGDAASLRLGEPVAAVGNPHNRANTVTFGVVTAKDQELRIKGRWAKLAHLIETDAAINGGNSGGALLDLHGRLVGINSAGGGTFTNRGFAIMVDHVRQQTLELLFAAYKLRSPDLGLRLLDDEQGVAVLEADPRGPAFAAGVRAGDRVRSLASVPITWSPGFALTLLQQPAAVPLRLEVQRAGAPLAFDVAPLGSEVWAVLRQSGLLCRNLAFRDEPERVRGALVALHRTLTKDPVGEPAVLAEQVVVVDKVHQDSQPKPVDLQSGDLLLALELVHASTGQPVFVRLEDLGRLRDLWNDRELGTYEGSEWRCWIARGTEIRTVELVVKRLFW
ncbi:MAG: trypsin-like peptidase domain-containing protein [Planctomycetes bacterium]|nr:trypsin-like peptidase domain-containing protein [Planctomycetota bacterium]